MQTMRTRIIQWLAIGGVLLLAAALFLLSFRLMSSRTAVDVGMSTYRTGDSLPDNMAPGFALDFAVEANPALEAALTRQLRAALAQTSPVGKVAALETVPAGADQPFLLVEIEQSRLVWTPLYAQAELRAVVFYDYDGDVPWPRDEPVVMHDSPVIQADGEFTLSDRSWGLISWPAYADHLGDELAQAIAEQLAQDVFTLP